MALVGEGEASPGDPSNKPGDRQGFDLVKAIGDIGGALIKELSKDKETW